MPPPALSAVEIQRVLDSVDRSNDVVVRDFAIIMLIARLALRSIEFAPLQLHDVDWRAGELVIRGKGRRLDRLPLPAEVGEALVAYLFRAEPAGCAAAVPDLPGPSWTGPGGLSR